MLLFQIPFPFGVEIKNRGEAHTRLHGESAIRIHTRTILLTVGLSHLRI